MLIHICIVMATFTTYNRAKQQRPFGLQSLKYLVFGPLQKSWWAPEIESKDTIPLTLQGQSMLALGRILKIITTFPFYK